MNDGDAFYRDLPVFEAFASLADPGLYRPLPPGWAVGLTDVVNSTEAVRAGRYKVVNTAGASAVAAVSNALGRRPFPFAFGGDGASFAVAGEHRHLAAEALAATVAWVRDELALELRAALIPVEAIRQAGVDVRIARFGPSPHVSYAMFAGGGLRWGEEALKRGAFAVEPGPSGARPDLTGLSCRWEEIPSANGVILSLILLPAPGADPARFRALVEEILDLIEISPEAARPLERSEPVFGLPGRGVDTEARIRRRAGEPLLAARAKQMLRSLASSLVFRFGLPSGRFDPAMYTRDLVANTDSRKYEDGLRMTVDCSPAFAEAVENLLRQASREGVVRFGHHAQTTAILTCITPSVHDRDHVHFLDGADGGYAMAALRLKEAILP